jgi:very-short-patch-repair endonuclease
MKTSTLFARYLRKNKTPTEKILWNILRNKNFHNLKFKRQKPIKVKNFNEKDSFYIVDFYCAKHKLIIEIDGGYHKYYKEHDKEREETLSIYGYHTLRFTNSEIKNNLEECLDRILDYVNMKKL